MYPRISRVGDPRPIALDAYETLAGSYAVLASSKPHNAYYERPATLLLLGKSQEGNRVLDAGCGPGIYAELWVGKGGSGRLRREREDGAAPQRKVGWQS